MAHFADVIRPTPRPLPDAQTQELRGLLGRRQQLIGMRTAEQNRLAGTSARLQTDIAAHITWLNTRLDRACLDVNEFGWVCGWVMECMEKGYLTEKQVGFKLAWGDVDGAYRLVSMSAEPRRSATRSCSASRSDPRNSATAAR